MNDATLWWIAAGVIVGLELLTGTFYLLMLALGAAAAALCAQFGGSQSSQVLLAGIVGGAAVLGWHLQRQRRKDRAPPAGQAKPNLPLDPGQTVAGAGGSPGGHTRVTYRGAQWDARHHGSGPALPGPHRIKAVDGNSLVLEKI